MARSIQGCNQVLALILSIITIEINATLLAPLLDNEVKFAVFQIGGNKS